MHADERRRRGVRQTISAARGPGGGAVSHRGRRLSVEHLRPASRNSTSSWGAGSSPARSSSSQGRPAPARPSSPSRSASPAPARSARRSTTRRCQSPIPSSSDTSSRSASSTRTRSATASSSFTSATFCSRKTAVGLTRWCPEVVDKSFEVNPRVVVIDSSKALQIFTDEQSLRAAYYELASRVAIPGPS